MIPNLKNQAEKASLHEQVAENLRRNVLHGLHPGVKLESEAHLARRLGVSVNTLRQALSILAHEGLIERRHGSGTFVADPRKQKAVALATTMYPGLNLNSFQMRLFLLLHDVLRRHGYHCRSYIAPITSVEGWAELVEDIERGRIAGAVFVAMNAAAVPIPLAENHVPYLQGDATHGAAELDYVDLVRQGVSHLVARGCRRIGLMQWMGGAPYEEVMCEAFRAALTERGAPVREEWIQRMVPPGVPGAGWERFREVWAARAEKPDGLLVTDDMMFRDVAMAILDSRIEVPQQLQVVVHANKGSGVTYPFPVSLLEVDLNEWAEGMVHRLIQLMNHEAASPAVQQIRARLIPAGEPKLNLEPQQSESKGARR